MSALSDHPSALFLRNRRNRMVQGYRMSVTGTVCRSLRPEAVRSLVRSLRLEMLAGVLACV